MGKGPTRRGWVRVLLFSLLSLLGLCAVLGASAAAGGNEAALPAQYGDETPTTATPATEPPIRDIAVPPGNINTSGGGVGPSTVLIAGALIGTIIIFSLIGGGTLVGRGQVE